MMKPSQEPRKTGVRTSKWARSNCTHNSRKNSYNYTVLCVNVFCLDAIFEDLKEKQIRGDKRNLIKMGFFCSFSRRGRGKLNTKM